MQLPKWSNKSKSFEKYNYVNKMRKTFIESPDWKLVKRFPMEKVVNEFSSVVVVYEETYYNEKENTAYVFVIDELHKKATLRFINKEDFESFKKEEKESKKQKILGIRKRTF